MNGGGGIVSANIKGINVGSYIGGNMSVSGKTVTANLGKINHVHNVGEMLTDDKLAETNLLVKEYTLEELMEEDTKIQKVDLEDIDYSLESRMASGAKIYKEIEQNKAIAKSFEDKLSAVSVNSQEDIDLLWAVYNGLPEEQRKYVDKSKIVRLEKEYKDKVRKQQEELEER